MIRFLLLNGFVAVYTILLCMFGLLLSLFDRKGGALLHSYVAVPWARLILWVCGVKVQVRGLENLDPAAARIYLCNHQSYFDIFALLAYLPIQFKFVMKKELMSLPLLGPTMRRAGYIGIDREDAREALKGMNQAAEKMKKGASILVFPEGTRSPDGSLQPFKPGAFHIALKSQCDIVPLIIDGSRLVVPKGSLRIQKGSFALHIGKPIPIHGYSKKNMPVLLEKVRDAMAELMTKSEVGEQRSEVSNQTKPNVEH
ncbi:MAG: 1-acyl-sn-glycerol-3-phosphate acyltransferase [Deltaproteobacteria bacterium HGW-Deltaproteobacteria-15]|jgi:1-acyl-sn-glycerol-3-phosphate acyltransferase|nr:MAG: 1-acyl-sn-glycerol-3-phosphate acyltransferase [Deltaproteobacteria bacterium HGW-Deltaproteobacteria-15]